MSDLKNFVAKFLALDNDSFFGGVISDLKKIGEKLQIFSKVHPFLKRQPPLRSLPHAWHSCKKSTSHMDSVI